MECHENDLENLHGQCGMVLLGLVLSRRISPAHLLLYEWKCHIIYPGATPASHYVTIVTWDCMNL